MKTILSDARSRVIAKDGAKCVELKLGVASWLMLGGGITGIICEFVLATRSMVICGAA